MMTTPTTTANGRPMPEGAQVSGSGAGKPLIVTQGLTKRYGSTVALTGLDLEMPGGQIVGLLGENGCGKTTLLKILAGVLSDYEGEVSIAGLPPGPQSKAVVSFLPDVSFLRDEDKVSYCITMFADFFDDFDADKARDLIGFFKLNPEARLREMSKGMREKVQVALAMSRRAKIFLLDEPISGVDPSARELILQGVLRNLEDDALLLISTHLIHDLEPILDGVVMMRDGNVLIQGDADDLREEHGGSLDSIFREMYR